MLLLEGFSCENAASRNFSGAAAANIDVFIGESGRYDEDAPSRYDRPGAVPLQHMPSHEDFQDGRHSYMDTRDRLAAQPTVSTSDEWKE